MYFQARPIKRPARRNTMFVESVTAAFGLVQDNLSKKFTNTRRLPIEAKISKPVRRTGVSAITILHNRIIFWNMIKYLYNRVF